MKNIFQMKLISLTILITALALAACSGSKKTFVAEPHTVTIDHFEKEVQNIRLAKDLSSYDSIYVLKLLPSFEPKLVDHIRLDQPDRNAPEIVYNLNVDSKIISTQKDSLKEQLTEATFALQKHHLGQRKTITALEPAGQAWLETYFTPEGYSVYEKSSKVLKDLIPEKKFKEHHARFNTSFGALKSTRFVRGHHYENYMGKDAFIQLTYSQDFDNETDTFTQLTLFEEDGTWKVGGYTVEPKE